MLFKNILIRNNSDYAWSSFGYGIVLDLGQFWVWSSFGNGAVLGLSSFEFGAVLSGVVRVNVNKKMDASIFGILSKVQDLFLIFFSYHAKSF